MKRAILLGTVAVVGVVLLLLALVPVLLGSMFSTAKKASSETSIAEICSAGEAGQAQIPEEYREDIANAAKASGISQEVLAAQIWQESRWDPQAVSPTGAKGIAQFIDESWQTWGNGKDVFDPHAAIDAQGRYMGWIKNLMKDIARDEEHLVRLTLAGYNIGPDYVHGLGDLPFEVSAPMDYQQIIMDRATVYTTDCTPSLGDVVVSGDWTHPLPNSYFTSAYGYRGCIEGVVCNSNVANHNGNDFSTGGAGTIVAATAMKVTTTGGDEDTGVFVRGRQVDEPGYVLTYLHCASGSVRVSTGQTVPAGTALCTEGQTGAASGNHLHFQINVPTASDTAYERTTTVDPRPILEANGVDVCPPGRDITGPCTG